MGSMFALHAVAGPVRSPRDLAGNDAVLKELVFHELVERGIYLAARGFVALSTAITEADCDAFVDALTDALAAITAAT
jgi:glutamate-1-semialdehyde 2,1-aminomutase